MSKAKTVAAEYFKSYPKVDEFFITSDEQAFFTPQDATNHGKSLKNTSVVKVTRTGDEESVFDDTKSKVVYVDKEDTDTIEALEDIEHIKTVVTEESPAVKAAQEQIEKEQHPDQDNDGIKTDAEKAKVIEEAKTNQAPNGAEGDSIAVDKAAKKVVNAIKETTTKVTKPKKGK